MLGRNTEMNLLQMNRQKNESACGIPFIFLVYLTGVVQNPWRFL